MTIRQTFRVDRSVQWRRIATTTATLVVTATLLIHAAAEVAVALGDPELVATVAGLGAVVLLLGIGVLAVARRFEESGERRAVAAGQRDADADRERPPGRLRSVSRSGP